MLDASCIDNLFQCLGALLQLPHLLIIKSHIDRAHKSLSPNDRRDTQRHTKILLIVADRPDILLIEQNALTETRRHAADAVVCRALVLDDVGSFVFGVFCDGVLVEVCAWFQSAFQWDAADGSDAPRDELALAVLAEDVCVNAGGCDFGFVREDAAQARAVEEGAGANDLRFWEVGVLLCKVGDYIDRVGHEEEDGVLCERLHIFDCGLEDRFVAADEIRARLAYEGQLLKGMY